MVLWNLLCKKVLKFAEGAVKKLMASLDMCWHWLKELFKMCWQACHAWDLKMKNILPYKCNLFKDPVFQEVLTCYIGNDRKSFLH